MNDFEKWKYRYENGYATENHIYRLVNLGVLTEQQYTQIVGQEFPS
jgi:hypothetical protein